MKVFVSAGEVSGDQILGRILAGLRARFPELELSGLGGEACARAGLRPLFPLVRTAISGAGDVLRSAGFALSMRRAALRALEGRSGPGPRSLPDLVLLVDYPGLNLGLARRARSLGLPVYYVAPPQAWVYRHPAAKLRRAARALRGATVHVLFPFEAAGYPFAGKVVTGHFLASAAPPAHAPAAMAAPGRLCLCPGSRLPVLRRNLPAWLKALAAAGVYPGGPSGEGVEEVAVLVPGHLREEAERLAEPWRGRFGSLRVTADKEAVFSGARWAFAFPGTVTLELALRGIPAAVMAVLDPLTLALGRLALRERRLGLPNLLLEEEAFPEWAGLPRRLGAEAVSAIWRDLRSKARDWGGLGARLRDVTGPPEGPETAVRECCRILMKA